MSGHRRSLAPPARGERGTGDDYTDEVTRTSRGGSEPPDMVSTTSWQGERGAVAVEFAIISTLLIMLLFGIVEFGIAFSKFEIYVGAAREGARYAAVQCVPDSTTGCTNALIATKVTNAAAGYTIGGPGGTSPSESMACSGTTVGQSVTVSWVQPITISIPFWKAVTATSTIKAVFR